MLPSVSEGRTKFAPYLAKATGADGCQARREAAPKGRLYTHPRPLHPGR